MRHLREEDKDGYFLHEYPSLNGESNHGEEEMSFDEVDVHRLDEGTGKWYAVRGDQAVAEQEPEGGPHLEGVGYGRYHRNKPQKR